MKSNIIIHGGAGSGFFPREDRRFRELGNALEEGRKALRNGSSMDGVVASVSYMEDVGVFNAGRGSCLTVDGRIQLDAAVMDGKSNRGAGVGVVTSTHNPVKLARWLAENTRHVLVAGEDCGSYLASAGLATEALKPTDASLARFTKLIGEHGAVAEQNSKVWNEAQRGNTVGAVAIDTDGNPAAAVSTGGMWLKLPGRVGDSAILGAGVYAEKGVGAACATGTGEEIVRNALCLRACGYLRSSSAPSAARSAIAFMTKRSGKGTAGIIAVDRRGRVGAAINTEAMGRAWFDDRKGRVVVTL